MEAVRSMLGCPLFSGRQRSSSNNTKRSEYTELTDEKALLFDHFSEKDSANTTNMPYMYSTPKTACYGATCRQPSSRTRRPPSDEDVAESIVRLLRRADYNDAALQSRIRSVIGDGAWSRKMVEECLDNIIECVEDGRRYMGEAMCEALERATDVADDELDFPRRHAASVDGFIAIVAVGILAQMTGPWVLDVLGFGEVEDRVDVVDEESGEEELSMSASSKIVVGMNGRPGSVAAWWEREFAPYIPRGGVYEYFKGLGMVRLGEEDFVDVDRDYYSSEGEY